MTAVAAFETFIAIYRILGCMMNVSIEMCKDMAPCSFVDVKVSEGSTVLNVEATGSSEAVAYVRQNVVTFLKPVILTL